MENLKAQIKSGVADIAEGKIDRLANLWKQLFEPEIGEEHMKMLLEHVDAFFTDIIVETENRGKAIKEKIDSLIREKMDLKRLLKEDANEVSTANVPLHTLQMNIDESLRNLREKLRLRREEIDQLMQDQAMLIDELEESSRSLVSDPLPAEEEMQEFRDYLESLRDEKYNRIGKILQTRDEIKQLMGNLGITSLSDYEDHLVNNVNMKPTVNNIEKLQQLHEIYITQFEKMKFQIGDMRKRLTQLWKYLDVSENHSRKYAKYTDVTQTTYDLLLAEVQRCEQIKKENIKTFIEKVRVEIEEYWDKCLKSKAERLRFPSYTANTFTEDVLELHEDELRDLKNFYENNQGIFEIIKERQDLWNQMEMMQNKESDPKRYNNRGGQLLKEEKERKMIAIKLPKIEKKLLELVEKFEEENNRAFTVDGVRIQDIIERDYETKRQEKLTKSGKKVQATPMRTPMRVNMTARTPLTVEQTIINRTAMKTTGGRLRTVNQRPAMSTTASSTASSVASVRTENGKRKLIVPKSNGPQAKRQLLGAFASPGPSNVLRPVNSNSRAANTTAGRNGTVVPKNPSLKVFNVGSLIKRRSRKSVGKKRRSSMMKKGKNMPKIHVIETSPERDQTSYEGFENYVYQSKSVVRSSEISRPHFLGVNHHGFASPIMKKPPTPASKRIGTPSASTPTHKGLQPKELEFSMII